MSGGTADDGKGATGPDATNPHAASPDAARAEVTPASAGAGPARQSEWTASDHRGPLRAPTDADRTADEVERIVPGSEVDAEGLRDAPTEMSEPPPAEPPPAEPLPSEPLPAEAPPAEAYPPDRPLAEPPAQRRSPLPLVAGVIVGALIGAGSAALVYATQGGSTAGAETSAKLAALSGRVDALEKRPDPQAAIGDVRNEVHALAGRVAALEKRPAAPAVQPQAAPAAPAAQAAPTAGADLAGKVAALQAALDAMGKQDGSRQAAVKDLAAKVDALGGSLSQVKAATRSDAEAAKGQQQDLDGKLAALQAAVAGAQKQASAVQGDLSTVQGNLTAVQGEQKALAGKVGAPALAVAADSLVAQVEAGKPYRPQLDVLASLGADPARLAVLRENAAAGVPSAQALQQSFAQVADAVVATGNRAPAGAGFGDQLKHGLFGLVNVHRADDTAGNDLSSRAALLQADLAHGDVGGAFAVWTALPGDAKDKSSAFGAQLKSSAETVAAARGLQAQSIDGLATGAQAVKKS